MYKLEIEYEALSKKKKSAGEESDKLRAKLNDLEEASISHSSSRFELSSKEKELTRLREMLASTEDQMSKTVAELKEVNRRLREELADKDARVGELSKLLEDKEHMLGQER